MSKKITIFIAVILYCVFAQESNTPATQSILVSDFDELQTALNDTTNDTIEISNDISLTDTLVISRSVQIKAADQAITLTSAGNKRHITVQDGSDITLTFENVILDGNNNGGGIRVFDSIVSLTLKQPVIQNCRWQGGTSEENRGGGIYSTGTLTLASGTISGNTASQGGGIYTAGNFTLLGGNIRNNMAAESGGGIYDASGATIDIEGGAINQNQAITGGGIYVMGIIILTAGELNGNQATEGGGIYAYSNVELNGGDIIGNSATNGGGIFAAGNIAIRSGTLHENRASSFGGGLFASANVTVDTGEISGNTSSNGGGIWSNGRVAIYNGKIIDNIANTNGGGIWVSSLSLLTADASTVFADNKASQGFWINADDIGSHNSRILATQFSSPFEYGYNNYDIVYTTGTPIITHTVTFHANGGMFSDGNDTLEKKVSAGSTVSQPIDPVISSSYFFDGWYTDNETFLRPWDFTNDTVSADTILYAKWNDQIISVEVPEKILFQALLENDGDITSETYDIINLSNSPVNVYFTQLSPIEMNQVNLVTNAKNSNEMHLDIHHVETSGFDTSITNIVPNQEYGTEIKLGTLKSNGLEGSVGSFRVGGRYQGTFPSAATQILVKFTIHFELEADE